MVQLGRKVFMRTLNSASLSFEMVLLFCIENMHALLLLILELVIVT